MSKATRKKIMRLLEYQAKTQGELFVRLNPYAFHDLLTSLHELEISGEVKQTDEGVWERT